MESPRPEAELLPMPGPLSPRGYSVVALQDLFCFLQGIVDNPEVLLGTKVFQGVLEPAQGCLRMERE